MRIAILIAGALIAASLLIAFRWQISAATGFVYRLDRWTGSVTACDLSMAHRIDCEEIRFAR
jgi:hypothetical protein